MKKLLIVLFILFASTASAADFITSIHKENAKKTQQACYSNSKWAGKNCNAAGKIWLNRLHDKEKAIKWFKFGCEKKGYFRACTNYRKLTADS